MTIQFGAELIERYLHTRQVRYFRGHHDDEYFFLVNAYHGRLHVHLEPCGPDRRMVKISITAERYYPVTARAAVAGLADQWNGSAPAVTATVFASSDPRLVGVVAARRFSTAVGGDFGSVVDQSIQSAIDLFGRLKASAGATSGDTSHLLDAG